MIRVDLHTHTWYSPDSLTSPERLIRRARAARLDRVAVTDHGVFGGALEASRLAPDLIIPGEEMKCACGAHLIGLFMRQHIPNGLSVQETADRIRAQGGVVYAPHPFAYVRHAAERAARALSIADVVEVFNARAFVPSWNRQALAAVNQSGKPGFIGSDAHFPAEIGRVYTEMPEFGDAQSFLAAAKSVGVGRSIVFNPLIHAASISTEAFRTGFWLRRRWSS